MIIATYNSSKTIANCINSVIDQDFDDFEVIIKDNMSKDNTINIIKDFFRNKNFKNYKLLISKDSSVYDAWNIALKKSRGEYIMFLGSDDFLKKKALAEYYYYVKNNNNPMYVYCKAQKINTLHTVIYTIGHSFNFNLFKKHMCVVHTGSIHHKKIFEIYGLFNSNYKIAGDYDLLLRFYRYEKFHFLNKVLLNSLVGGISEYSIKAQIEAMKAKINHKTNNIVFIYIDTLFIIFKLLIKKTLRYSNVNYRTYL